MDLLISLKKLIKRINQIAKKSKILSKTSHYATNPFASIQNKTYVWVDKTKDSNDCKISKNREEKD